MFERYPEVQNSFSKFSNLNRTALSSNVMLHAHSLDVMHMIGRLVALLSEPENLLSTLVDLGHRHQRRGATDELLQVGTIYLIIDNPFPFLKAFTN